MSARRRGPMGCPATDRPPRSQRRSRRARPSRAAPDPCAPLPTETLASKPLDAMKLPRNRAHRWTASTPVSNRSARGAQRALLAAPLWMLALGATASFGELATGRAPGFDSVSSEVSQDDRKEEFDKKLEEAGRDRKELWKLYDWCDTLGMKSEGRKVLRQILKVDDGDKKAHELLGHVFYDGQWFTTQKKADTYKKKKLDKEAKAKGWVKFKGEWVDPAHIPFLEKGWVLAEDGTWMSPEMAKRLEEGWQQVDFDWVSPDELENVDKGLWKCGSEWLSLAEADKYHGESVDQRWRIRGDDYHLESVHGREFTEGLRTDLDLAYRDLENFYGTTPAAPFSLLILDSLDSYNEFAAGSDERLVELSGFSSLNMAFLADAWFDLREERFNGMGVAYWDNSNDAGNRFGRLGARSALGLSFAEALDPSPKTTAKVLKSGKLDNSYPEKFYGEKQIPQVLRMGGAVYVQRYFLDRAGAQGGGDLHWARKWSVDNIERQGGLDPLKDLLAFELRLDSPESAAASTRMVIESGLVVAFIMQGRCEPVIEAHKAWQKTLATGDERELRKATTTLFKALQDNESAYREFARS